MSKLPLFIKDEFRDNASIGSVRRTPNNSLRLFPEPDSAVGVEWIRETGLDLLDAGYAITGLREKDRFTEVWLDDVSDKLEVNNLAERAAIILRRGSSASFEPNDSDEPKEQYVDVYPDPCEQSSEDYSLKADTIQELRDEGIGLRCFSGGRERSDFNDENYRLWFLDLENRDEYTEEE